MFELERRYTERLRRAGVLTDAQATDVLAQIRSDEFQSELKRALPLFLEQERLSSWPRRESADR